MIQGDIYWVKFKLPDKRRPVLILTRSGAIPELNSVTVSTITTTIRETDSQVYLNQDDGVPSECVVNLDNIQTIHKNRLEKYITHLSEERMKEVFEAIKFVFGFERF